MKCVVVGGGIAGVSCVNEMLRLDRSPDLEVVLINASSFVKTVHNYQKVGQLGEKFDVRESKVSEVFADRRFTFINWQVTRWDVMNKAVWLENRDVVHYDKLCIATGARPFECPLGHHPNFTWNRVLHLRDTQSAKTLQEKLGDAKNVIIIGNGGIATELMYELKNVKLTWVIKDSWICAKFFPEDVEKFIEKRLLAGRPEGKKHDGAQKHIKYTEAPTDDDSAPTVSESIRARWHVMGPSLGPDWCSGIDFNVKKTSENVENSEGSRDITIIRNAEVTGYLWPDSQKEVVINYQDLKDKSSHDLRADLVIYAGGVRPNSEVWMQPQILCASPMREICVNEACETNVPDVYACGDVCALVYPYPRPHHIWNQKKLWTQARQFGEVCGRSIVAGAAEAVMQNMYFEMFTHCTEFFGMKVVFLGDYKPQSQPIGTWKIVLRDTEEDKLVRCVVVNRRVIGALLIGETDMEETLENLILNKTDLQGIAETFLEPGVDLDDYFD